MGNKPEDNKVVCEYCGHKAPSEEMRELDIEDTPISLQVCQKCSSPDSQTFRQSLDERTLVGIGDEEPPAWSVKTCATCLWRLGSDNCQNEHWEDEEDYLKGKTCENYIYRGHYDHSKKDKETPREPPFIKLERGDKETSDFECLNCGSFVKDFEIERIEQKPIRYSCPSCGKTLVTKGEERDEEGRRWTKWVCPSYFLSERNMRENEEEEKKDIFKDMKINKVDDIGDTGCEMKTKVWDEKKDNMPPTRREEELVCPYCGRHGPFSSIRSEPLSEVESI